MKPTVTALLLAVFLLAFAGTTVASTEYYVAPDGDNGNLGTVDAPWRTIEHAIGSISPGDTVIIREGVYRVDNLRFGPSGLGFNQRTIFKSSPGERVVISRSDDLPPAINMNDFVRVEGFWMGGSWDKEGNGGFFHPGGSPVGRGKQIIGNTIFGYRTGINIGSSENLTIHGNRLVHNGNSTHDHGMYIAGGYTLGSASNHIIVDGNIVVNGEGYGIHGWHEPRSNIITRNFVAQHNWGIVMGGGGAYQNLIANNLIWTQKQGIGANMGGYYMQYVNNIHAEGSRICCTSQSRDYSLFLRNAFFNPVSDYHGLESIELQMASDVEGALGKSRQVIDSAVSALDIAFSQPVEVIFSDQDIESHFQILKDFVLPQDSPLAGQGEVWIDTADVLDISPSIDLVLDEAVFWKLFRDRGLVDYDNSREQHSSIPVISNVDVNAAETSAIVSWFTNELSEASIVYGIDTTYGEFVFENGMSQNHSLSLGNLSPCTTYYLRARSRGTNDLITASENISFSTICDIEIPTPTQSPPGLIGDINGDGRVDIFDYNLLIAAMGTANAAADLNADGVVDMLDYGILMDNFGGLSSL